MSSLPFELLLALRYVRPKRTFVSVITFISVLGVTLGVAVLIIVISVMSGFDRDLKEKFFGFNAHLTIFHINPGNGNQVKRLEPMSDPERVMNTVNANPAVQGSTPFISEQVLVETEAETGASQLPLMRGIDTASSDSLSLVTSNVIYGTNDLSGRGLLVGISFAENMHLQVGDRVAVSALRDIQKMRDSQAHGKEVLIPPTDYEVRGIFDSRIYEYNYGVVITSLQNAQQLLGLDDNVHGVMVMLHDPYQAARVESELNRALGTNFLIRTWEHDNSQISAVLVEKNVMFYILFFIVIVAAFGITCTLITFVVLKTKEIGVLKALGATNVQVMGIFLSQSLVVSVLGVLVGTCAGLLGVHYRNPFLFAMRKLTGIELFPADIYNFTALPAQIVPGDILIICGGSLIICLLASAFPVWNASRLKPVEALRHG
jgi:lipoprotein-releasing system permease protein